MSDKKIIEDFEKLCGQLRSDTESVELEFSQKVAELENIAAQKQRAKLMYERHLDAGCEKEMSDCLRTVREQNRQAEKLKDEIGGFREVLQELSARRQRLIAIARESQVSAAKGLKEAERVLQLARGRVTFCSGLQGSIDSVNAEMSEVLRSFERERKSAEGEMEIPRDNSKGFWIEDDDPFGQATLRHLRELKKDPNLTLPIELSFKDKGVSAVDELRLKSSFEKSGSLRSEFADLKSYLEFKSLVVVQLLETYVVRASGAGDRRRELLARVGLSKCKKNK